LAAAVVALVASPALAQRRGGGRFGMSGISLLSQKSVQDELKLTEDQVKKVAEANEKRRAAFQEIRNLQGEERTQKLQELAKEGAKTIAGILNEEQAKRFKQISLQVRGVLAVADPAMAGELKITDDQKAKLTHLLDQAGKDLQKIREEAGDNRDEARKKSAEYRKDLNEKVMQALTDEQKTKWKEMTGKPFKGEIRRGQRRRNDN
jgi:Spy/CpxP family protein refolding chaperone